MKTYKMFFVTVFMAFCASVFFIAPANFVAGCGGTDEQITGAAATVSFTAPLNGDTGVFLNKKISATFSEAMDETTITTTTFTLTSATDAVSGAVAYTGVTAVFTPASDLAADTVYTATITTEAKSVGHAPWAAAYTWSFTTGTTTDTTAPTVSSTVPVNATTGVYLNQAIAAVFDEVMDPLTITDTTFTLTSAAGAVSGTVTYSGLTAVFTPASNLAASTEYTATITTGATDLTDNALAAAYVWTFTTGTTTDTTAPTVSSTNPGSDVVDMSLNTTIAATFSEAMNPLTVTNQTFTLAQGTTAISGTVTYTGVTAVFTPASNLSASTVYTATISTVATDLTGNALAVAYTWSFTTGTTADTTAPTVSSTVPANTAVAVVVNRNITATFSEAMQPSTITAATFTLTTGATPVLGAVTSVGSVATFNPTSDLTASTTYTATITTGVKDLTGNALAATYTWSFTTGTTTALGPAPVNLGTAGNYVILAKTGVSTTGATAVTGDIGLSPAAASFITGFGLVADATNVFSTSALVTGNVYAANYAVPTPANMTTAVSDMQTAFTDAAGRTSPDQTELGAGNITGQTLAPGLYKWGTGVLISAGGVVTLNGGPNDVWIFQIAQDLTVSNGAVVTLTGGAVPQNIFWQVSGQTTLGTTADFKGIILSQTLISFNTGAIMNGRALAQTAVTLNATAITEP